MATPFKLTPRPIKVTGATKQALYDALDVSAFDEIDCMCVIGSLVGGGTWNLVMGAVLLRVVERTGVVSPRFERSDPIPKLRRHLAEAARQCD